MKSIKLMFTLAMFCLFFATSLQAQVAEPSYVIVEYMKVKPGMGSEYRDCEQVWKLIHQERKKMGLITGWELERVMFPSGTDAEYDYITITHLKNWKAIDELNRSWNQKTWDALTKNLTPEQKALADKAEEYRDVVKREIWTAADMIFAPGASNSEFRVENYMKLPANGWDDWMELEGRFVKPVHAKSIDMGNRAGWIMTILVMPNGADQEYDVSTVDFYNNWEEMNKSDEKAWEAIYPDMSFGHVERRINAARTLVRSEVRRLVDYVD